MSSSTSGSKSAPGAVAAVIPGAPGGAEGDWICPEPECANLNFARRTACNRCGKDKPVESSKKKCIGIEIGKAAAEKSRGLFSADDWQCTKCGNVNWARRSSCNVCNAPKFKEVEERTGYGGGYNDRGVVEYKERAESDDEYDEFGRKKKKFRKKGGDSQSEDEDGLKGKANERNVEDEEEDEEEDDDDDEEGDLSKYDLSDWGLDKKEDDDKEKNKAESDKTDGSVEQKSGKVAKSRSRSSSRSNSSSSRSSSRSRGRRRSNDKRSRSRSRSKGRRSRSRSKSRDRRKSRDRKSRSSRSRSKDKRRRSRSRERRSRSRSRDRRRR